MDADEVERLRETVDRLQTQLEEVEARAANLKWKAAGYGSRVTYLEKRIALAAEVLGTK